MTRRISRRNFIGGAAGATALTAGGATWAAIALRDSGATPATTDTTPTPLPTSTPAPTPTLPPPPPGGRQVIVAPSGFSIDTFDAQLTGKSSVIEVLGRTHSRLVQWDEQTPRGLTADLASSWEQPDLTTAVFHIDPKALWHDRPPLNGRPVTADDVVAHFRRSLQLAADGKAPLAQRYHAYASIDSVDSPVAGQVKFRLKAPDPFFLDLLASEFALVQALEAVASFAAVWSRADSDHVIGSGPWTFDWADRGAKFTAFRAGHRQPMLDELIVAEPRGVAQAFESGELDEAITHDRRDAARLRDGAASTSSVEWVRHHREIVMSSFFIGAPPWNNPELVTAISFALARSELVSKLFGARGTGVRGVPGNVWGSAAFDTLEALGGDTPGLDDSYSGARQKWQAAGGPGLGTVTVDFPSVFDPLYSASSFVIDQLNRVLGPQFRTAVETYTNISKRVREGYYGNGRAAFWFGWGPPIHSPRPQTYFAELYAPGSPGQAAVGGPGSTVGPTGAKQFAQNGYLGIVPWVHQFAEVFRRAGREGPAPSPFWNQHLDYTRRTTG